MDSNRLCAYVMAVMYFWTPSAPYVQSGVSWFGINEPKVIMSCEFHLEEELVSGSVDGCYKVVELSYNGNSFCGKLEEVVEEDL